MRSPGDAALALALLVVLAIVLAASLGPRALAAGVAGAAAGVALAAFTLWRAEPGRPAGPRPTAVAGGRRGRRATGKPEPRSLESPALRAASAGAGLFAQVRRLAGTATGEEVVRRARRFFDSVGRGFGRAGVGIMLRGPPGEEATLARMREAWLAHGGAPSPPSKCEARGRARVAAIPAFEAWAEARAAARGDPTFRYLDVGAAEGCITAALAAEFGLPQSRAVAVDVVPQPPGEAPPQAFEFVLTDGRGLPFPDGRFALLSMFMSAHHFADTDRMFAEAFRVARPGALLLLREHGRADEAARLYYDVVHAFYETVFRLETTPAGFAARYAAGPFALYRTVNEWARVGERAGFALVGKREPQADLFDTAYLLFRKP